MLKVLRTRLEQGYRTMRWPRQELVLPAPYRGRPMINRDCDPETVRACARACPQDAIDADRKSVDLGRCLFCGTCARTSKERFVRFTRDFDLGSASRSGLVCDGGDPAGLADHAKEHFRKLFGRSLQLRQVSAGGCNACEAEINVLATPAYDLSRFGISYVASPRHADGIHVTGPVTRNMRAALLATFEAVPEPRVVIASGACAISGGPFTGSPEVCEGLDTILPVDLYIPGCPPHPMTTLKALLDFFR